MTEYAIVDPQGAQVGTLTLDYGLTIREAAPAAPPEPRMVERRVMTEAANGYSYQQHIDIGWTDQALLDHGLMRIEMVPEDQDGPPSPPSAPTPPPAPQPQQIHESLQQTQLGPEWGPVDEPQQIQQAAPEAPQSVPEVPGTPAPPTTPEPPQVGQEQAQDQSGDEPEADGYQHAHVPVIEGREFIIRNVSYETVVDKDGVPFDARIHGVTSDNKPALKKDGTFKKRRNLDNQTYEQVLAQLKAAMAGGAQAPQQEPPTAVPAPPTADPQPVPAPPTGSVPPVPGARTEAPPTAPQPPADLAELEGAIQNWGTEI